MNRRNIMRAITLSGRRKKREKQKKRSVANGARRWIASLVAAPPHRAIKDPARRKRRCPQGRRLRRLLPIVVRHRAGKKGARQETKEYGRRGRERSVSRSIWVPPATERPAPSKTRNVHHDGFGLGKVCITLCATRTKPYSCVCVCVDEK